MVTRERLQAVADVACWAVVGASDDRMKYGNVTFRELLSRGKRVYPVNKNAIEVEGEKCYPNLASLPEKVDCVLIVVPPAEGENVVREAAEVGVREVWFQPGAESAAALSFCEEHGIEAIAGHCILMMG